MSVNIDFNVEIINQAPVVWSDNFFSPKEIKIMQDESSKLRTLGLVNDDTGSAKNEKGEELSKNNSVFLEKLYASELRLSDTINITRHRIFDKNLFEYLVSIHPYFYSMGGLNIQSGMLSLLSYYDSSQYYKPHRDTSFITVLTWFYENPKAFEGGDFIIENDFKIECKHGRTVFMPGYFLHEVTPVKMPEDKKEKGLGRYSITNFMAERIGFDR